ncbi:MAG: hypothetical protein ACJAUV_001190 [Flavobacteriales bacterium]|jgi:hypothetical protein
MRFIGEKISHQKQEGVFTAVISPKIAGIKETLLLTWLLAWTFCGVFFIAQLFGTDPRETKLALSVMVVFWVYFEFRIGKAYLWRKYGLERLMIKDGSLLIKNDIKGFGKAKTFFVDNVQHLGLIKTSNKNFFNFMNSSFWVIGGETIGFECLNKPVTLGQNLSKQDATTLIRLLESELKLSLKTKSVS